MRIRGSAELASGVDELDEPVAIEEEKESDFFDFPVQPTTSLTQEYFSALGPMCTRLGWAVIPQQRGERRLPGKVDGEVIKFSKYFETGPTIEEVLYWSTLHFNTNVAALLGPSSGNVFAIDIDVSDVDLVHLIEDVAYETLGFTPFKRIGNAPKRALLYRTDRSEDIPRSQQFYLMTEDGTENSGHLLEIVGARKLLTIYGRHHKTLRPFRWIGEQPALDRPELVPTVTDAQIDLFLREVQKVRAFHNNVATEAFETLGYVDTQGISVPTIRPTGDSANWVEDDGLVVDGREQFLFALVRAFVRGNPGATTSEEGRRQIHSLVREEFVAKARSDGRWAGRRLDQEIREKIARFARDLATGKIQPSRTLRPSSSLAGKTNPKTDKVRPAPEAVAEKDVSLNFIRGSRGVGMRANVEIESVSGDEKTIGRQAKERRLLPDRTKTADSVSSDIDAALDAFFDDVYEKKSPAPVHLLVSPTGSGKTSKSIARIGRDDRTKSYDDLDEEENPGPILFLLPTYNNIEELRLKSQILNLDEGLDDEELAAQALELNLFPESEIESRISDLRRDAASAGLRTMIYRGKKTAGCQRLDELEMLMSAGLGTSGLCKADRKNEHDETETIYCPYYHGCPAIQQRKEISQCHVVFLPHAFLTMTIPEELKKARAVIADEKIFHLFVHTDEFEKATLETARKFPKLTKKEKEAGREPSDLIDERAAAVEEVIAAFSSDVCPAAKLARYRGMSGTRAVTGAELVASALRVCGGSMAADVVITPDTPMEDLIEICSRPHGKQIAQEYRFWKIIGERIEQLTVSNVHRSLMASTGYTDHVGGKITAMGAREYRIQFIKDVQYVQVETDAGERPVGFVQEKIRISWRSQPNWGDVPFLLLDASAAPEIVEKVFGSREVVRHVAEADLNVKTVAVVDSTYSNSSIIAKGGTYQEKVTAAKKLKTIRKLLSMASSVFGYGRVVVGASVAVRRAVNKSWRVGSNMDFCHFGAMRGLDFAKNHVAAVSVGRMEIPVRTVDGLVAALSYDDDQPEEPFDLKGDGVGPDGEVLRIPMVPRVLRMRDGRDYEVKIPIYPGRWARIIQNQYREEELKQFLGRLRPVYRKGDAPVWIAASRVIPEGVVVDEIVHVDDLLAERRQKFAVWDAIRTTDGIVHPKLFLASCPFERESVESWTNELSILGFDFETGVLDPTSRYTWGFRPVAVQFENGEDGFVFARSELEDPAARVRQAFRQFGDDDGDGTVSVIEVGKAVRGVEKGSRRSEDWVEQDIGALDMREIEEARVLRDAALAFIVESESRNLVPPRVAEGRLPVQVCVPWTTKGVGGQGSHTTPSDMMTIQDRAALMSTETMLRELRERSQKKERTVITPQASDEAMGDTQDWDGTEVAA